MRTSQLIQEAKTGSDQSLNRVLEFYRPYIVKLAEETIAPWLRPKLSASDVAQGTLLLAWEGFEQFEGDTSSDFRAWILAIFRNHLRDGVRRFYGTEKRAALREAGEVSPSISDESLLPNERVEIDETVQRLLICIDQLTERSRQVVRMRYVEAKSFAAIGRELDCTPDMARRIWLNAIDELSKRLDLE